MQNGPNVQAIPGLFRPPTPGLGLKPGGVGPAVGDPAQEPDSNASITGKRAGTTSWLGVLTYPSWQMDYWPAG